MSTILELRLWAKKELDLVNKDSSQLDTDVLLASVLNLNRVQIISRSEDQVNKDQEEKFKNFILRRAKHEPIAYILEKKEFFGINFKVTPDTLIPRPETELLVEEAIKVIKNIDLDKGLLLVDVGTGSGAIILSILDFLRKDLGEACLTKIKAFALDISAGALEVAIENAKNLGLDPWINFYQGDLLKQASDTLFPWLNGCYDYELILANLPYIGKAEPLPVDVELYEPQGALRAEENGLELIFELIDQNFARSDKKQGQMMLEIGINQLTELKSRLLTFGIQEIKAFRDLQGIDRVISFLYR